MQEQALQGQGRGKHPVRKEHAQSTENLPFLHVQSQVSAVSIRHITVAGAACLEIEFKSLIKSPETKRAECTGSAQTIRPTIWKLAVSCTPICLPTQVHTNRKKSSLMYTSWPDVTAPSWANMLRGTKYRATQTKLST